MLINKVIFTMVWMFLFTLLFQMVSQGLPNDSTLSCGLHKCNAANTEVCFSHLNDQQEVVSVNCEKDEQYFTICAQLNCPPGTECRVAHRHESNGKDVKAPKGINCVYRSDSLDEFVSVHTDIYNKFGSLDETNEQKEETQLAWNIVIAVLCIMPIIFLGSFLVYHFLFKVPRQKKEKEDLKQLFLSLGYDENSILYKKVHDFIYK